ncbi:MAG: OB-fold nucleic acid binding domain-containing protein [Myxococcales bacterium]
MHKISMMVLAAVLALAAGCNEKKAEPAAATAAKAGAMATRGKASALKGKVLEKIDAATYSYLRLQTEQGETWAAVPQTATAIGTEVVVEGGMNMDGFESKSLGRKFDKIVFGTLGGGPGPGATPEQVAKAQAATGTPPADLAVMAGALPPNHPSLGTAADLGNIKVEKATAANAKTVAEVWAEKAKLKDAKVTVKGRVVKVNSGILGKTWIHLRDGSGSEAARDNDVTVTASEAAVAVGDVVTAEGTVRVDKDFGAGYQYPVIVEDASVKK